MKRRIALAVVALTLAASAAAETDPPPVPTLFGVDIAGCARIRTTWRGISTPIPPVACY